jgi:hypothetical protein
MLKGQEFLSGPDWIGQTDGHRWRSLQGNGFNEIPLGIEELELVLMLLESHHYYIWITLR